MNFEIMDMFDLAELGTLELFTKKFDKNRINDKTKSGFSLLHNALSGKKWDIAEFLINEGIDVNLTDKSGNTALHYLCDDNSKDYDKVLHLINLLLDRGVSINAQNKEGSTPLIKATAKSNGPGLEVFKLLLQYKPDISLKNQSGMSCLILAEQQRDFFEDPTIYNYLKERKLI